MNTEVLRSPVLKVDENKLNYLWLNGERVIGIEGLEIFEDCRQLKYLPEIKEEQRNDLNSIINSTLEKYAEEGICDYWPSLITKAKDYFSEHGYCVTKQNKVTIDLRQPVKVVFQSQANISLKSGGLTVAGLWNIHRQRKARLQRKYI